MKRQNSLRGSSAESDQKGKTSVSVSHSFSFFFSPPNYDRNRKEKGFRRFKITVIVPNDRFEKGKRNYGQRMEKVVALLTRVDRYTAKESTISPVWIDSLYFSINRDAIFSFSIQLKAAWLIRPSYTPWVKQSARFKRYLQVPLSQ